MLSALLILATAACAVITAPATSGASASAPSASAPSAAASARWDLSAPTAVARDVAARAVIDTTFPVRPNARLQLDGVAGTVRVRAWNRAEMQLRSASGRVDVAIRNAGDVVYVGARGGGRVGDDLEIHVPATFGLVLDGHALSADIEGVDGAIRVNSANGSITVRRAAGGVRAETLNGAITLEDVRGGVDVSATNHRISLTRVQGRIVAATVNGAITLRDVASDAVEVSTVNGAIEFRGAIANAGRYRFGTHNGAITLALAPATHATLVVSTFHGRINAAMPVTLRPGSSDRRATYTLGNGGAHIEVESFNGNIRLIRP